MSSIWRLHLRKLCSRSLFGDFYHLFALELFFWHPLVYAQSMCNAKADGGRRCAIHQPGTLAASRLATRVFGLTPEQVMHTFKALRAEGSNRPAPTHDDYERFKNRIKTLAESHDDKLTRRDKTSLTRWLGQDLNDDQMPDAAAFYAMKKLMPRARDKKREFVAVIRDFSKSNEISRNVSYQRFKDAYEQIGDNNVSDSLYSDFDGRTELALAVMRGTATPTHLRSEDRRIERNTRGRGGFECGYDSDDGRFEVVNPDGEMFVYRNVPSELVDQFPRRPKTIMRELNDNLDFYSYESAEDAEDDAYGRWCADCHEYRAKSGHVCDGASAIHEEPVDPDGLTLEAARARINEALEAENRGHSEEDYARPRPRMTARRRRWATPMEDREVVELTENTEDYRGAGNMRYSVPSPERVKEAAQDGNIVRVSLNRHGNSPSYARDFNTSPDVEMYYDLEFYCDDITGDVKMRTVAPRCNCIEYERNSTCRHVRSPHQDNMVNRYLTRDANTYHNKIDPLARARSEAMNGTYRVLSSSGRNNRARINEQGILVPRAAIRNRARNIIQSGGSVSAGGDINAILTSNPRHRVTGTLTLKGAENSRLVRTLDDLRCSCREENCQMRQNVVSEYKRQFLPNDAVSPDQLSRLDRLASVDESDWQSKEDDVKNVLSQFSVGIDRSYTANLGQYISDYREARQRIAQGEDPLVYGYQNVTNGICAPGKRAFGVEIEFEFGRNSRRDLNRIAREMYDAGLANSPRVYGWHHNARTSNPYSTWTLEHDATVDGEVVSPILHDTPETWEQLKTVCEIIRRNGGEATLNGGQHVHMGTVNRRGPAHQASHADILKFYAANEDSIRRVQTDPARKTHRNSQWAQPLTRESIQSNLYSFNNGARALGNDHYASMNFGYDDRIEFRGADASINESHIQAQVMMNAALVASAERGELVTNADFSDAKHQRIGTNARRLEAIRLSDRDNELTDDELIVSDASYRNFVTSLFDYDHGRKMMVGIAANTPWQN